jgi:hypothetical protein
MFNSGPRDTVATWKGRPDHVTDPQVDCAALDKPGLKLLGDRQIAFLEHWVADWRGADLKVLLSETTFANVATHHGRAEHYLVADLDSGGWPRSARDRALAVLRKGCAFHICGDQHLPTLVHHGIDAQRDALWSFCTPAIAVGYQRWWRPDEVGRAHADRPAHGLPHTGAYRDGLGNRIFVQAVGNPPRSFERVDRYRTAHLKSSGFGLCRFDQRALSVAVECYRFDVDLRQPREGDQFPGWPVVLDLHSNRWRAPVGHLGDCELEGVARPVVQVIDEARGELVYALRSRTPSFRPWVYAAGTYTVRIGDPDTDTWRVIRGQQMKD